MWGRKGCGHVRKSKFIGGTCGGVRESVDPHLVKSVMGGRSQQNEVRKGGTGLEGVLRNWAKCRSKGHRKTVGGATTLRNRGKSGSFPPPATRSLVIYGRGGHLKGGKWGRLTCQKNSKEGESSYPGGNTTERGGSKCNREKKAILLHKEVENSKENTPSHAKSENS